jgi:hypothetical protein
VQHLRSLVSVWGRDPPDAQYGFEGDVSDCDILYIYQLTCLEDQTLVSLREDGDRHCLGVNLTVTSYFSGFRNKDVAFLHVASKSLIEADLLLNLPATEQVESQWDSAIVITISTIDSTPSARGGFLKQR